ncbi:MAG: DUF4404 family protein [Francisellaceae bacterium]
MPKDTIDRIKVIINTRETLNYDDSEKLGELLIQLEEEIHSLPENKRHKAIEVINQLHEKIKSVQNQPLHENTFDDLKSILLEYEVNHPRLTSTFQAICNLLANIGI